MITAVTGSDDTLRLLETATGKELQNLRASEGSCLAAFHPTGKTLAT